MTKKDINMTKKDRIFHGRGLYSQPSYSTAEDPDADDSKVQAAVA